MGINKELKENSGGYFLIEALIAVIIVMTALVPIIGMYTEALKNADNSASRTEAVFLAQERMEELKAIYDLEGNLPAEETNVALRPQNNITFYRSYKRDISEDFIRVTVTVEWTNQNRKHSVEVVTFIK